MTMHQSLCAIDFTVFHCRNECILTAILYLYSISSIYTRLSLHSDPPCSTQLWVWGRATQLYVSSDDSFSLLVCLGSASWILTPALQGEATEYLNGVVYPKLNPPRPHDRTCTAVQTSPTPRSPNGDFLRRRIVQLVDRLNGRCLHLHLHRRSLLPIPLRAMAPYRIMR